MKPYELFDLIKKANYITSGDCVDWTVEVDFRGKVIRLLFEESIDRRDWINNFNFPAKVYKKQKSVLKCARGWGNAYRSCNDIIMNALIAKTALYPDYDVHICGWSYGGALSVIAAEDFHYRTGRKASVYTFGSPNPLWGKKTLEYVKTCVNEVKQYAHVNDCVTLCVPFPGYKKLSKDIVGAGFSLVKLCKPWIYHCIYGDPSIYESV